jgi:hypothetical protein
LRLVPLKSADQQAVLMLHRTRGRYIKLFIYFPILRRLPARLIGLGVRRERITSQMRAIPQAANHSY